MQAQTTYTGSYKGFYKPKDTQNQYRFTLKLLQAQRCTKPVQVHIEVFHKLKFTKPVQVHIETFASPKGKKTITQDTYKTKQMQLTFPKPKSALQG